MRHSFVGVAPVVLSLFLVSPAAFSASTSPGKSAAFESATGVPLPPASTPLLTASISKGKPKRVLAVEAMLTNANYGPGAIPGLVPHLTVAVNGIPMQPTTSAATGVAIDCGSFVPPPGVCTLNGTWWLDLDANPALIGAVLSVALTGGDLVGGGVGSPVDVTLSVRMQKK